MAIAFKEKLGPLPVWGWGVIAGLLIVGYMFVKNQFPGDSSAVSTDDSVDTADPGTASGAPSSTGVLTGNTDSSYDAPAPAEATNGTWLIQAVKVLTGQGVPATTAQAALIRYLDGSTLSAAQADIVNKAVKALGAPPEGVPEPTFTAPATAPAKATPIDYSVTVTASVPKSVKVGKEFNVSVTVKARDPRAGTPTGKVTVSSSGITPGSSSLASNGTVNRQVKFTSTGGGIRYLTISYSPTGKWKSYRLPSIPITVVK